MCECACHFTDVGVSESINIWPTTFFSLKIWARKVPSHRGFQTCVVDALQTFTWQKQPGQDVGTPKNRSKGEVCLHM